jgi:hypothetical protein
MESHFKKVYREIRSILQAPNETVYIVHTSVGAITLDRFRYTGELGYVFLEGRDENGKLRFVGFSEAQLATFAFELQPKSGSKNSAIGFQQGAFDDVP